MMQSGGDTDEVLYITDGYCDHLEETRSQDLIKVTRIVFSESFLPSTETFVLPVARNATLM